MKKTLDEEEYDPDHAAAAERDFDENAERAEFEIRANPMGRRYLRLNDDASVMLDKHFLDSKYSKGQFLNAQDVVFVTGELRRYANSRDVSPGASQRAAALADAIDSVRTSHGNAVAVKAMNNPMAEARTRMHEFLHLFQSENGITRQISARIFDGIQRKFPKEYAVAAANLRERGYSGAQIPEEIPAWISSGEGNRIGLDVGQGAKMLREYLDEARRTNPGLGALPELHPDIALGEDY